MPGSTPVRSLPYPVGTDPINAYPALGQDLATKLDGHTHDRTTVPSAAYADTAGNANALGGVGPAGYAPASHGQHPPAFGSIVVACGSSGTPGDTGLRGLHVATNGDTGAYGNPLDFVNDANRALLARILLTGSTGLAYLGAVGLTNATIRVNYVQVG